jgi:hypothetical protein
LAQVYEEHMRNVPTLKPNGNVINADQKLEPNLPASVRTTLVILEYDDLREAGHSSESAIKTLADRAAVSERTIRRDLWE